MRPRIRMDGRGFGCRWALMVMLGPLCLGQQCGGPGTPTGPTGTADDLPGTWNRTDGMETLVIADDGRARSTAFMIEDAIRAEVPCDGERHPVTATANFGQVVLEVAIEPFRIVVDAAGGLTMEEHRFRVYEAGAAEPGLDLQVRGVGRLDSPTTMTIDTTKRSTSAVDDELNDLAQHWTYTKASK